ncbi:3-oxoacyl-ACP reductase FabG [Paenibacillus motobuensis]|uniref:SDR family oxidoreductase n=1 Tax=Paenibacillus lutimineralis TaxID=2707005 RepID=A0A3S9V0J2_9BACL|nr:MULTISPECIES: 3-oxoacyl-ACP reductase FabG [Paenibacillus]AZS16046.1 SDR family oxidoreductase [Paenibacillus lutimineralis]MCM3038220.1 3-oxoacyl-ACP reductase FabG [Paenibacillus lutimineralis]MCM3645324.1 3-oxoacyl-ACP reductase FabG [Paenibacillus motobuensis]
MTIQHGSEKNIGDMTVLVTGASRGIGAQIALRFAAVGMNVVIHYLNSHERANEVARQCMEMGAKVHTISADLRSKTEIERMKERLAGYGLYPDILVNNAGISHYGLLTDVEESEWDEIMDVNLKSVFLLSQAFMPYMISQRFGRIINVSSVWGISGGSCEVVYSAAKGGVNAFTKALAKEVAPSGVTVNAVAPGAVKTDMMDRFDAEELKQLEEDIPVGRLAAPEEISSLVYFLALPESSYITGQIISPNGGWVT